MGKMLASEDFQTLSAQFVLLKIESGSDENKFWAQFHQKKQAAIPQVYIIRSDGTELYNEVGGLSEEGLKKLMEGSLEKAGKPIEPKVAKELSLTADKVKRMIATKKLGSAAELLNGSSRLVPVSQESFAMAAVYFNQIREQLDVSLKKELERIKDKVSESSSLSVKQKVQFVESTLTLLEQVEGLESIASSAEELKSELKTQLSEIVEDLEMVAAPDTSSADLEKIKERYAGTAVAKRIETRSRRDSAKSSKPDSKGKSDDWLEIPDQQPREWKSDSGSNSVKATLLAFSADAVKLKKDDGKEIKVPLSRLSEEDRSLVESKRKKNK